MLKIIFILLIFGASFEHIHYSKMVESHVFGSYGQSLNVNSIQKSAANIVSPNRFSLSTNKIISDINDHTNINVPDHVACGSRGINFVLYKSAVGGLSGAISTEKRETLHASSGGFCKSLSKWNSISTANHQSPYLDIVSRRIPIIFDKHVEVLMNVPSAPSQGVETIDSHHQPGSMLGNGGLSGIRSGFRASSGVISSPLRVPSGGGSSQKRPSRCKGLPEHDLGLVVGNQDCLFGGVRRASGIIQGLCAGFVGVLCLCASFSFYRTFPIGKPSEPLWTAPFAACLMTLVWCFGVLITGYVWLPWL